MECSTSMYFNLKKMVLMFNSHGANVLGKPAS